MKEHRSVMEAKQEVSTKSTKHNEQPQQVETSKNALYEREKRVEAGLASDVRRGVSDWIRLSNVQELPKWVRNGILLTRLFGIETASAGEINRTSNEFVPVMSESARFELEPYVHDQDSAITINYIDSAADSGSDRDFILKSRLESDEAIVFDRHVSSIWFQQELPMTAMPSLTQGDTSWTYQQTSDGGWIAAIQWPDQSGNKITVIRSKDKEKNVCEQTVMVDPAFAFAKPGEEPKLRALHIDLSQIGGRQIFNAFWYRELPAVETIGGNTVYSSGVEVEEVEKILAQYGDDMSRGSNNVDALFGYHQPASIVMSDNSDENAYYSGWGTVSMNTALFTMEETGWAPRSVIVEEVMEHELFHYRDEQYGLSRSPEMQMIFASASPEVLMELNESGLIGLGFGGHAQENEREFVATILNSIDMADWDTAVRKLSPEARDVYKRGLDVARKVIADRSVWMKIDHPPIVQLLSERVAVLESLTVTP